MVCIIITVRSILCVNKSVRKNVLIMQKQFYRALCTLWLPALPQKKHSNLLEHPEAE